MSLFNSLCVTLCLILILNGALSTDKHHTGHTASKSKPPKVHPKHHDHDVKYQPISKSADEESSIHHHYHHDKWVYHDGDNIYTLSDEVIELMKNTGIEMKDILMNVSHDIGEAQMCLIDGFHELQEVQNQYVDKFETMEKELDNMQCETHVHTHNNYISGISKQSQIVLACAVVLLLIINYLTFLVSINWDAIYNWMVTHARDPAFAIGSGIIALVIGIVTIIIAYIYGVDTASMAEMVENMMEKE